MKKRKIAVLTWQNKFEMYDDQFKDEFEGTEVIQYGSDFSYDTLINKAVMLEDLDYDAIIARGYTCGIIKEHVSLPLVIVEPDMLDVLQSMIKLAPEKGEKITLLFQQSNNLLRYKELPNQLHAMFGVETEVCDYYNMSDYFQKVDEILMRGRTLFSGHNGIERAKELGGKCSPLYIGENAIRDSIVEAIKIIDVRNKDAIQNKKIEAILSSKSEGILTVDENFKVGWINDYARSLLSIPKEENIKNIDIRKYFPDMKWDNILTTSFKNVVIDAADDVRVIMNTKVLSAMSGEKEALLAFRQTSKVIEEEKKIRAELHKKGQYAKFTLNDIKGYSKAIIDCKEKTKQCAKFNSNILIYGESGVGKELFAQCIHNESQRAKEPFYAINCAALPENLLESELFGYSEGSFTGAKKGGKAGIFELAHKGTVFLDEIGELSLASQSALLRVLQEKEIRRIGDDTIIPVDVRVIAASHKDIYNEVLEKRFRQDLFYRLGTVFLTIPPLRERQTDIWVLMKNFIENFSEKYGLPYTGCIAPDAYQSLMDYRWEGNVRELQNFVERLFVLGYYDKEANSQDVRFLLSNSPDSSHIMSQAAESHHMQGTSENFSAAATSPSIASSGHRHTPTAAEIQNALEQCGGNKTKAAELLGISRTHLWRLMQQ